MRKSQAVYLALSAVILAAVAAPLAIAADDGGGRASAAQGGAVNGSSGTIAGSNSSYTLYARNTNNGDGGAQADTCTSNVGNEACFNMVNFGTGFAGSFRTRGNTGFLIQTSGAGTATPFQISPNATGVVQYLNADTVDGLDAAQLQGSRGPAGVSGYQQVSNTSSPTSNGSASASVSCPTGKEMIGQNGFVSQSGQGGTTGGQGAQAVMTGVQSTSSTAATANAVVIPQGAGNTATYTVTAQATCANVS